MIIHYYDIAQASKDVILNKNFFKLYKKFCPGPITFVLKKTKSSKIVSSATSNLNTVAIRFPNHKIIKTILKLLDFPLAMPSANLSSKLSPVNAVDVFENFKKNLKIIIDGGQSKIGIESTVVDLTKKLKILRPGIIDSEEIKKVLKVNLSKKGSKIKSPGMLKNIILLAPIILGRKPKTQSCLHRF